MIGIRALLVRNLTIQAVAEVIALGCGLITAILLSRSLGVEGFGAFNYAFAFIYFFLVLNDFGINTVAVREISRAPSRAAELLGALLTLRMAIAVTVLLVAWVAIAFWPMAPGLRRPLAVFALILPLNGLNVPALIFQTAMRFELGAIVNITQRILGLLLIGVAVLLDAGLLVVLSLLLLAEVVGVTLTWVLARRLVSVRMRIDPATWKALARAALPIGISLLLVAVINRADFLMLERMTSLDGVGLYGAAYRVIGTLEKFPIFVMSTLYPVMSHLAIGDSARLRQVYRRALWRFGAIALPLALATSAIAPWLMATLMGEPYRAAAGPLRYLVWSTACLYLAMTGGYLLISVGREYENMCILAAGAAANIALNFALIPSRGVEGAAMATALSYLLVLLLTLVCVERQFARARVPAS